MQPNNHVISCLCQFKVNKGVEATLVQLFDTGLLHADPHPGNLRYTPEGCIGYDKLVSFMSYANLSFIYETKIMVIPLVALYPYAHKMFHFGCQKMQ